MGTTHAGTQTAAGVGGSATTFSSSSATTSSPAITGMASLTSMTGAGTPTSAGGATGFVTTAVVTTGGGIGGGGSTAANTSGGPEVDLSEPVYAADQFPRFDLSLPAESMATLRQVSGSDDPLKSTYVTGSLEYNGERVDNIGVRLKGEGSFRSIDDKPALKLKFDSFVEKQEFQGLRRLTLNNMVEDPSFLAERLAYTVFRAAGLPAPRCNSATLYINGEYYGVYANLEAEDKTFLSRWYEDNDGNLYEEGQVDFDPGAESTFNLETNETVNDRSDLTALILAIQNATGDSMLPTLEPSLDTSQFLRFTAAEAAVNQWDMYGYTVFWPNNFRIYNDPSRGKFTFLPWGMDMSMKPYRDSGKPHIGLFEVARQFDRAQGPVSGGRLLLQCFESLPCRQAYSAQASELISVYESLNLESLATTYYTQIEQAVLMDSKKDYSQSQFEAGYQALQRTIRERPQALRDDLAAM